MWIDREADTVSADFDEIKAYHDKNPQPFDRDAYLGLYEDTHSAPEEPFNKYIRDLAKNGIEKYGHHGKVSAMGVPLTELPRWESIQFVHSAVCHPPAAPMMSQSGLSS